MAISRGGVGAQTPDSCYTGECRPGARCRGDLRAWICEQGCVPVNSIRPINRPLQLCLELDERYPPPFSVLRWPIRGSERDSVVVFSIDSLPKDFCCAQRLWTCVCGAQDNPCVCTVKVRFVRDTLSISKWEVDRQNVKDFTPRYDSGTGRWRSPPTAFVDWCPSFWGNGQCDTSSLRIWLNSVDKWMRMRKDWSGVDTVVRRFFVNRSLLANTRMVSDDPREGYAWYDLCMILAHELGHLLGHLYGMHHHEVCDSAYKGVMLRLSYRAEGFTEDDRCIFAKLYCPHLVGVQETGRQEAASQRFNSVCVPVPEGGARIGVRVYNLYGALVLQLPEQYHFGGQWCRELSTEQLAAGVYLCVVSVERRQYRQLVLVIR